MNEKASLLDKLQEMEHLNTQLAEETETIGDVTFPSTPTCILPTSFTPKSDQFQISPATSLET